MHVRSLTFANISSTCSTASMPRQSSEATSSHLGFEAGEQTWVVPLTDVSEVVPVSALCVRTAYRRLVHRHGEHPWQPACGDRLARFANGSIHLINLGVPLYPLAREISGACCTARIRGSLGLRQTERHSSQDVAAPTWQSASLQRTSEGHTWRELTVQRVHPESPDSSEPLSR